MTRHEHERQLLRCSAFEELMLDQDSPQHPCVICVRLDLSGELDTVRLQRALAAVIQAHPLLRAHLVCRWGKLWWRISGEGHAPLQIHATEAPAWPIQRHFDLGKDFGVQADLYPTVSDGSRTLFLQFHHAATDGLGCLQVAQQLLREYANSDEPAQRPIFDDLANRNRFGLTLAKLMQVTRKQFAGLAGVRQFLSRRPVTISPSSSIAPEPRHVAAVHYRCTLHQTSQLKQVSKQHQVTLNELLACFVFEACNQLRQSRDSYQANDWLRMMVPMSMRDPQAPPLSACNVVSCIFLDRTGLQIADRSELLRSIHEEMELIKRHRLGFTFLFSLWLTKIWRLRSRQRALVTPTPRRCQTSLVFSNMGRLFESTALSSTADGLVKAGSLLLDSLTILAPVAPLMNAAITTFQYAGRITLALRYDPGALCAAEAERLIGLIVERIDCETSESAAK